MAVLESLVFIINYILIMVCHRRKLVICYVAIYIYIFYIYIYMCVYCYIHMCSCTYIHIIYIYIYIYIIYVYIAVLPTNYIGCGCTLYLQYIVMCIDADRSFSSSSSLPSEWIHRPCLSPWAAHMSSLPCKQCLSRRRCYRLHM